MNGTTVPATIPAICPPPIFFFFFFLPDGRRDASDRRLAGSCPGAAPRAWRSSGWRRQARCFFVVKWSDRWYWPRSALVQLHRGRAAAGARPVRRQRPARPSAGLIGLACCRFVLPRGTARAPGSSRCRPGSCPLRWCGVPIAAAYRPVTSVGKAAPAPTRFQQQFGYRQRMEWLLGDLGTWKDLLWLAVNAVVGTVALLAPIALVGRRRAGGPERGQPAPGGGRPTWWTSATGTGGLVWCWRRRGRGPRPGCCAATPARPGWSSRRRDTELERPGRSPRAEAAGDPGHRSGRARRIERACTPATGRTRRHGPDAQRGRPAIDSTPPPPVPADRGLSKHVGRGPRGAAATGRGIHSRSPTAGWPTRFAPALDGPPWAPGHRLAARRPPARGRVGRELRRQRAARQRGQAPAPVAEVDLRTRGGSGSASATTAGGRENRRGTGLRGIERQSRPSRAWSHERPPDGRTMITMASRRAVVSYGHRRSRGPRSLRRGWAHRIVIAEDQFLLRDGLIRLLEAYGFEVAAGVDNGDDLLAEVRARRPTSRWSTSGCRRPSPTRGCGRRCRPVATAGLPVLVLSQYVEKLYASELLADGAGAVATCSRTGCSTASSSSTRSAGRRRRTVMDPEVIARLLASMPAPQGPSPGSARASARYSS